MTALVADTALLGPKHTEHIARHTATSGGHGKHAVVAALVVGSGSICEISHVAGVGGHCIALRQAYLVGRLCNLLGTVHARVNTGAMSL